MTNIPDKITVIGDEHVDNTRTTYFNKIWWYNNNDAASTIGLYTLGTHSVSANSLHLISCGWGQDQTNGGSGTGGGGIVSPDPAADDLITKNIYDEFGAFAGLAQLRTGKPTAADAGINISTEPNINTAVTLTDVVMEGIVDHSTGSLGEARPSTPGADTDKPHQDTIHIISEEDWKVGNRYFNFLDASTSAETVEEVQIVTHTGNWGSNVDTNYGPNGDILNAYIDLNFPDFPSARRWWNQGGKITLKVEHSGVRTGSTGWSAFLGESGTIYMSMAGDIAGVGYGAVHYSGIGSANTASKVTYQYDDTANISAMTDPIADFGDTGWGDANGSGKKRTPFDYHDGVFKLLYKAVGAGSIYSIYGGAYDPYEPYAGDFEVWGKRNASGSQFTFKAVLDNTNQGTVQDGVASFKWGHVRPVNKDLEIGNYHAYFVAETYSSLAKQSPTGDGGGGTWA